MTVLTEQRTDNTGRTYYQPILTKITGTSKYKDTEYSLEGIDGFWEQGRIAVPPQGTLAWFTLTSKPKTGMNAKPGSKYLDIVAVERASDADKANYQPPTRTQDSGRYNAPIGTGQRAQGDPREQMVAQTTREPIDSRITRAQAINNRFTRFAALVGLSKARWDELGITAEQMQAEMIRLEHILLAMDTGELPQADTVGVPSEIQQEAEQLDNEADAAINEPEIIDGQEVQSLPW